MAPKSIEIILESQEKLSTSFINYSPPSSNHCEATAANETFFFFPSMNKHQSNNILIANRFRLIYQVISVSNMPITKLSIIEEFCTIEKMPKENSWKNICDTKSRNSLLPPLSMVNTAY